MSLFDVCIAAFSLLALTSFVVAIAAHSDRLAANTLQIQQILLLLAGISLIVNRAAAHVDGAGWLLMFVLQWGLLVAEGALLFLVCRRSGSPEQSK